MQAKGLKKTTLILSILAIGGMLLTSAFSSGEAEAAKTEQVADTSIDYKKKWKKLASKEPGFTIYFPGKAQKKEVEMPVPGDSELSLNIASHTFEKDGLNFSLSYTQLPEPWLKYGSSLVLKGALKLLAKHADDADIAGKSSNTFKEMPSLDYSHIASGVQTRGTLVLCGDKLFAVEVKHPEGQDEASYQAQLKAFLESFNPASS